MGIFDHFKKQTDDYESKLINALYERVDKFSEKQLVELLRYIFFIYGKTGLGFALIQRLTEKINKHAGISFVPDSPDDFNYWAKLLDENTTLEIKKSIFVTAAFDVYKSSVISGANLLTVIDDRIKELEKTPEFTQLK